MAKDRIQHTYEAKAAPGRTRRVVLRGDLLSGAKREAAPVPRNKDEAMAQIEELVRENKPSLDALAKL